LLCLIVYTATVARTTGTSTGFFCLKEIAMLMASSLGAGDLITFLDLLLEKEKVVLLVGEIR